MAKMLGYFGHAYILTTQVANIYMILVTFLHFGHGVVRSILATHLVILATPWFILATHFCILATGPFILATPDHHT